jgi:hypothetical protein
MNLETKKDWTRLYVSVSNMSFDSCYDILAQYGRRYPGLTLLEIRKELRELCLEKGADRWAW